MAGDGVNGDEKGLMNVQKEIDSYLYLKTKNWPVAEELRQEVWLVIFRKFFGRLLPSVDQLKRYAQKVAEHKWLKYYERQRRSPLVPLPRDIEERYWTRRNPASDFAAKEMVGQIRRLMGGLQSKERALVECLTYGASREEIRERLGISKAVVLRKRIFRIKWKIFSALGLSTVKIEP